MYAVRNLKDDITYLGVEDRRLHLFENIFPLDRGVTYNSYLIQDEKTALLDTVDHTAGKQFLENLEHVLCGRKLDYLIVNHMEPDHCALIDEIVLRYPEIQVVSTAKTFQMISQFFTLALTEEQKLVVKEGDELSLGKHVLSFVMAPMVHWPEVMFTYDKTDGILFSADAFGVFGTNNGNLFADEMNYKAKDFTDDARRYYSNIVGKYGMQVQNVLKKACKLEIRMICPLHGPVWREDLDFIVGLYDKWSKYEAEDKAVAVFYNSVYGNTESVINALTLRLAEKGVKNIAVYDVSKTDVSVLISESFRVSHIVFGATTYNNGLFPKMENLIQDMKALTVQNKKYAIIENGTWAPAAGKLLKAELDSMKNMEQVGETLTVKSATFNLEALDALACAIAESLK
ncbi:FprA family A-type flavoprotein [Oribacterium sp. HCP28S3_H8]|jgi:flavorubredoxin|uniref:FprA family A-type flavoprotein n=1 Tax=Oribacterium sp. HCP28S3_H8 TaxID=3438945 RepID=UPI003F8B2D5A